jgi:hypothetical protein
MDIAGRAPSTVFGFEFPVRAARAEVVRSAEDARRARDDGARAPPLQRALGSRCPTSRTDRRPVYVTHNFVNAIFQRLHINSLVPGRPS